MWNPEAGPPPDPLIHAIQESRAILQTSSAILSQEGGAAVEAETGAEQDPELWDQDEGGAEEMADFEDALAPGGPPVEATVSCSRKAATGNTPITPPPKKTHSGASGCGAGWSPVIAGPKVVNTSHAESQRHRTFCVVTTCMCDYSALASS